MWSDVIASKKNNPPLLRGFCFSYPSAFVVGCGVQRIPGGHTGLQAPDKAEGEAARHGKTGECEP